MARTHILPNETLLTVDTYQGSPYVGESDVFQTEWRLISDAIKGQPDSVIQILIFNRKSLVCTDITEDCALIYLEGFTGDPDDDSVLPEYVRESDAWERWCENYRTEYGFGLRAYRQYGTLNHPQQFGGRS